ncbi:MAG: helix-turn-helix domain-containing protein [Ignavibacteriaceae bacterium]
MQVMYLKTRDLIDTETGIHYAYHKSLGDITFPHNHDFFEIFLITKGKAIHKINGKEEVIEEGTLVFIRPDDTHFYERFNNEPCELINVAFPASTIKQLFDYFGEGYKAGRLLRAKHPPTLKLSSVEKEVIVSRFEKLNTLSRGKKSRIKTEMRILLAEIFSKYFAEVKQEEKDDIPSWLVKVRSEMEKKENFIPGISRMYELSARSPEHLSRSLKKYYKETPTKFINKLRLNYAANLLVNTYEDITAIAMDSGFENLSHFYHLFKINFGISPKEFRGKHQKSLIPF